MKIDSNFSKQIGFLSLHRNVGWRFYSQKKTYKNFILQNYLTLFTGFLNLHVDNCTLIKTNLN